MANLSVRTFSEDVTGYEKLNTLKKAQKGEKFSFWAFLHPKSSAPRPGKNLTLRNICGIFVV